MDPETASFEAAPREAVPFEPAPFEAVPREAVPREAVPREAVPFGAVPFGAVPFAVVDVDSATGFPQLSRRRMLALGVAAGAVGAVGSVVGGTGAAAAAGPVQQQPLSVADFHQGGSDWTAAFQRAIDAANPNNGRHGGGRVLVPAGEYPIRGGLRVHTGVVVSGEGWGSYVRLASNANKPMFDISETTGPDGKPAFATGVENMRLNGNGTRQGAPSPAVRIATGSATTPIFADHRHTISNLFVQYINGDGIRIEGTRATRVDNVYLTKCSGAGVNILNSSDGLFSRVVSAGNADGFVVGGASNNLLACRASRNTADGFRVTSSRTAITNGYSLDNGRDGYRIVGNESNLTGCVADSNRAAGLHLAGGSRASVSGLSSFSRVSNDNGTSPFVQEHGVKFATTSANFVTGMVRKNRTNVSGSNPNGVLQVVSVDEL